MLKNNLSIMDLCASTDEIDIFDTSTINEVILFKWNTFGFKFHLIGAVFHLIYMVVLVVYNYLVYLKGDGRELHEDEIIVGENDNNTYSLLLAAGTIYPAIYDHS